MMTVPHYMNNLRHQVIIYCQCVLSAWAQMARKDHASPLHHFPRLLGQFLGVRLGEQRRKDHKKWLERSSVLTEMQVQYSNTVTAC